jgi:HAD superfamily hydrolase (TIGR01484 family)
MHMYKALITDLDATVVPITSDGKDIDKATRNAIQRAQKSGYIIACATGRGWPSTQPVVKCLGLIDPCIIEGGARIVDPTQGTTLWEKYLNSAASAYVLEVFKKYATGTELFKSTSQSERVPIVEVSEVSQKNRILYLLGTDRETAEKVVATISQSHRAAAYKTTPSWCGDGLYDVHVTHVDATKKNAIRHWFDITRVSAAETIGLGDSENDLPLFESVGLRIAVGNATDSLKQQADHTAPTEQEGALRYVIETFLLPLGTA